MFLIENFMSAYTAPYSSKTRKLFSKKKTITALTPKYDSLCEAKMQLAEKELLLVTNRIEYEKLEHEKRMENLALKNQKLELENKKLKLELGENLY